MKKNVLMIFVASLVLFTSCKNNDEIKKESATFKVTVKNVFMPKSFGASGTFDAIPPGGSVSFSFNAGKGAFLSFATMFVKSNDLFYGFSDSGLSLYDAAGNPVTGDVTSEILLWDAGTEVNQMPGTGSNQPMNQPAPNTGEMENATVHPVNDGFTYPETENTVKFTLMHDGGSLFTVKIENVSGSSILPSPFAPGVWAIHSNNAQIFKNGEAASEALERLAEDGGNTMLGDELQQDTGYFSPFAPGVFAVHEMNITPIFKANTPDMGKGLEALAEDGDPSKLAASLSAMNGISYSGVFNTPDGTGQPGPLFPDNSYSFTFTAEEGDYLSLALMLVHSNDLFYAFSEKGIPLFNGTSPKTGDVTSEITLWDAGTEVNEFPGAGNNQPARGGAGTGMDENGKVMPVNDGFSYPAVGDAIQVQIELQ